MVIKFDENKLSIIKDELFQIEKNLIWSFTSFGTTDLSKNLFEKKAEFFLEPFIGQHMGIITNRRGGQILTNFDIHKDRKDYFFSEKFKDFWLPYLRLLILSRLWYQFQNTSTPIIVNDFPAANFGADFLIDSTQQSKSLFFVRDGRQLLGEKISNDIKNEIKNGLEMFSEKNKQTLIIHEAQKWKKMVSIAMKVYDKYPKNCLIVKLEELENEDKLEEVFKFLKFDYNKSDIKNKSIFVKEQYTQRAKESNFWEKNFSKEEQTLALKIIEGSLARLNYKNS